MGSEDEAEQSNGRPCRQANGRSKRTCELTSSIVPRGTSFHCAVEPGFPPIGFDLSRLSCRCRSLFPGPTELGAINPHAVHDHGQPARQCHDCLFHPAAPGDLHSPGLESGPFFRTHFVSPDPNYPRSVEFSFESRARRRVRPMRGSPGPLLRGATHRVIIRSSPYYGPGRRRADTAHHTRARRNHGRRQHRLRLLAFRTPWLRVANCWRLN